jgi:hypothetical protein
LISTEHLPYLNSEAVLRDCRRRVLRMPGRDGGRGNEANGGALVRGADRRAPVHVPVHVWERLRLVGRHHPFPVALARSFDITIAVALPVTFAIARSLEHSILEPEPLAEADPNSNPHPGKLGLSRKPSHEYRERARSSTPSSSRRRRAKSVPASQEARRGKLPGEAPATRPSRGGFSVPLR